MADPLSVAGSITGVVALGFQVAKGLYKLADGIGSAGKEVRAYANEVDSFSKLFRHVRQHVLDNTEGRKHETDNLLMDILSVCERVLEPLQQMQGRLNPLTVKFRNSPSRLQSFRLRLQWLFSSKDKLLWLRGVLAVQHRLLDTTLEMMILQSTKDRSPQNISILKVSLENSVDGITNVLQDWRQFPLLGGTQRAIGFLSSTTPLIGDTNTEINETKSVDSGNSGREEEEDKLAAFTMVTHVGDREVIDDEDEMTAEQELDEQIQDAAQDIWEDTRVISRKVVRHVKNALRTINIRNEDTRSYDSSSNANIAGEHRNVPPYPRPTGIIPDETSQRKVTTGADTASSEIVRNKEGSIRFAKPDDISYEVPLSMVSKWEDMLQFIQSLYSIDASSGLPIYARGYKNSNEKFIKPSQHVAAFHSVKWDIRNETSQVILPQFWEAVVRPNRTYSLIFGDINLQTRSQVEGK